MRIAVCLALVAACASRLPYQSNIDCAMKCPRPQRHVDVPAGPKPQPWKVGQWAEYRATRDGKIVLDAFQVVAIDSCGTWLQRITETAEHRWTWLFCFRDLGSGRASLEAVLELPDTGRRSTLLRGGQIARDPAIDIAVSALLPQGWLSHGELEREDLDTAAGHFDGAVRGHGDGMTVWVHSAVPFGGVIKIASDDGTYQQELYAYGEDVGAPSAVSELATSAARQAPRWDRPYVEAGATIGRLGLGLAGVIGAPLRPNLDGIVAFDASAAPSYGARIGVRLTRALPRKRGTVEIDPYLQGTAGYSEFDRFVGDQDVGAANGLAVTLAAGFVEHFGRDWALVGEVSEALGIYDAHEGLQHFFTLTTAIQLTWP